MRVHRTQILWIVALGAITMIVIAVAFSIFAQALLHERGFTIGTKPKQAAPVETQPLARITNAGGSITGIAYSPDGNLLAFSSIDGLVHLWSIAEGKETSTLSPAGGAGFGPPLYSIAFSPDGKMLAAGSEDAKTYIWDMPQGELMYALAGHQAAVWSVRFSASGKLLVTGSRDGTIRLWEAASGTQRARIDAQIGMINSARISTNEKRVAGGGSGGAIYESWVGDVLDQAGKGSPTVVTTGYVLSSSSLPQSSPTVGGPQVDAQSTDRPAVAVEYSPDGNFLAGASRFTRNSVILWRLPTGNLDPSDRPSHGGYLPQLEFEEADLTSSTHLTHMTALAFSTDSKLLAANIYEGVWLFRMDNYRPIVGLQGHTKLVTGLAFSPDATTLASSSEDGTVCIWHVPGIDPLPTPTP